MPAKEKLVEGRRIGIDAATLEADAAMRSIVRRDTGETYEGFLKRLAKESGIETPTREELAKFVKTTRGEISTYRRQFMLARRSEAKCNLTPTVEEKKSGLMVLQPPPDGAFVAGWTPTVGERAGTVKVLLPNIGWAMASLAIVPTRFSQRIPPP